MSPKSKDYLEIHKLLSEELRHTATVFWRFAVAIVTLQATSVGFSMQKGAFDLLIGKAVLLVAFSLSFCFSVMLYRHARDRAGFVERIKHVEEELRADYPRIFFEIKSRPLWFKSYRLAEILVVESGIGAIWFAYTLFSTR